METKENLKAKIKELYLKGHSIKEIKEQLGITSGHYVNDVIWNLKKQK